MITVKLMIGADYLYMRGVNGEGFDVHNTADPRNDLTYLDESYPYVAQQLEAGNLKPLDMLCKLQGIEILYVRDWSHMDVRETWVEFKQRMGEKI